MSEYTKGPWQVILGTENSPAAIVESPEHYICQTVAGNDEANAHLIAAAPELYEALKALVIQVSPEPEGRMSGMAQQKHRLEWFGATRKLRLEAEKILAKAEGKS